jgi:type I restriction enzyme R subunit
MMTFTTEAEFEEALIKVLSTYGWSSDVIKYPTEEELLQNWANILYENNRQIDRLHDYPLTRGEMQQIVEQIINLKTPMLLNGFINGKTVAIVRDNPEDKAHLGKEISLKIYDRMEIAGGQSRYQIVQQSQFPTKSPILNDRRGDLMLLINGMPVIHIELKKSGIPVSQAANQIEKYAHEGIFSGLFSLVQIFVAMNPEETLYFANPGPGEKFNADYYFHWADFNNEPINAWDTIASTLLSIPMAHQLIGFYTVADATDGILKVMRSYQYNAANRISDKVAKTKWDEKHLLGGYIWHTTGSGKTMTSFKSAQLIADSKDADKVVFLVDRIELGTQSLLAYQNFADANTVIQATENTGVLVTKLKSSDPANVLIVTSIQKMSNITSEDEGLKSRDLEMMTGKRIVFIVDEAHRSTFGDMLIAIKKTFPGAIFFGFTGTPIQKENQKHMNTTNTVFGNELHRYSIADGIRDKNVLGFDPYMVLTYRDKDLRKAVALDKAHASSEEDAISNPMKRVVYYKYMDAGKVKMAGEYLDDGKYVQGIEDYLPPTQYTREEHQKKVVEDIADNWLTLSRGGKFHAIFATSSIHEAIEYYKLIKKEKPDLKITALFDPYIDNKGGVAYKEDGLEEIMSDYNAVFDQNFNMSTHDKFKKDIALRLSHKEQYKFIENEQEKQLNIVIVVDQMLTGFDSKWVNTLYMDKVLKYENVIQAFSRTNRLFGPEKPFGTIRYYRKPHTMAQNIEDAVRLYSGNKPFGLFVDKLEKNLTKVNELFEEIKELFANASIENFVKLPEEKSEKAKFAKLFNNFQKYLIAAKIQGFVWDELTYEFSDGVGKKKSKIRIHLDENIYKILVLRYKELQGKDGVNEPEVPFDVQGYITEIDTGRIDAEYMNSRFEKFLKTLNGGSTDAREQALAELHKSFATLTQEEQKYANIFLHDVQSGDTIVEKGKTLRDYITECQAKAKSDQIHGIAFILGLDESKLRSMMSLRLNDQNINEYGRFDELKATVNKKQARNYFETVEGEKITPFRVNVKVDELLRDFIITGGFAIADPAATYIIPKQKQLKVAETKDDR